MFTPGSKYFLGLTGASAVALVLYMMFVNPSDLGAVALFGLVVSSATIGAFALRTRDGDVASVEDAVEAASPAPAPSFWPVVFVLGVALILTGLATVPPVFMLGLAVFAAGGVEWAIDNWSDRASADPAFNGFARHRLIGALEYPGAGALVLGVVAYMFSRVMLAASKEGAAVLFIVVASFILLIGYLVAFRPSMRGRVVSVVVTLSVVALVVSGVTGALVGERKELAEASANDYYSAAHRECGAEASEHFDKHANNNVSMRSAVIATVTVANGELYAQVIGLTKKVDTITLPKSSYASVLFRNKDSAERRLVANLGEQKVADTGVVEKIETCTQLTGKKQENVLTLSIPKKAEEGKPYTLTVPGVKGEITVVVP